MAGLEAVGVVVLENAGLYSDDGTNMVVSRGLGNSIFPFRINNPPEIVLVELKRVVEGPENDLEIEVN